MILMIDNYDSFTYNIVQYCLELGSDLKVVRNDQIGVDEVAQLAPEKIILSPGPSTPDDAGITLKVIERYGGEIPMLGICLGHQSIAQVFGAKVVRAKRMMHGKTSQVQITDESPIFHALPKEFRATRYHSLVVDPDSVTKDIVITSKSKDDGEIMSLQIKDKAIYGVQFHPESIMSEYGREILANFLKI